MFRVPFPPNVNFVDRSDVMAEIEAVVSKNKSAKGCFPTVLKGLGGMGKSQLMLNYCYEHRKDYGYVFWLDTEGSQATLDEFQNLAKKLGINVDNDEALALAEDIRTWFQSREERWLLALDNVEAFEDVFDFIPHFGGDVIVTTRNHVNKSSGSVIHVGKMAKEDALLLLIGPETCDMPPADAVKIVEALDCMPLAVDMARAYIDRTGTSLKAYLELYNRKRGILFKNEQDKNRNLYAHNVATVWDLSFKMLRERSRLAGLIIGACAFLHPDAIPVSLFERQSTALHLDANVDAIREAVGILVQFSFVRRTTAHDVDVDGDDDYDPARDLMAIHRLVQEVIRESIVKDVGQKAWGELLVTAMNNEVTSYDYHVPRVRKINNVYIPHIRNVVTQVDWRQMDSKTHVLLIRLLNKTAEYLRGGGAFQSGVEFALVSVSVSEASGDVDRQDLALSFVHLALLYKSQGKYGESELLYQRALAIDEKVFGPDHSETAKTLGNLAQLYSLQGKYDEAKPLFQRALAIKEKVLGPDHQSTGITLNNLGVLYKNQGKYGEAEPMYQRALALYEKVLGPDHPEMATTLDNLAQLYGLQRKYDEAELLCQQALAIYEKVLGPDHQSTGITLNNLGVLYKNQGKYGEAEPMYQRALALYEKVLGPDHPEMATTLDNLAQLYGLQRKYDEAELLCQQALAIYEKVLGPDHLHTGITLNNLAHLYKNQGKYDEAEPMYQRALAIYEKVLGSDHLSTGITLNNLGLLYDNQGKYDEAEPMYQRALAIYEKVLGPDHSETAATLDNLAQLYDRQGKYDEAEPLFQRALVIREKMLGSDHPSTGITLNNLGLLYKNQGKYDEAEPMYQRALAINEKVLGPVHSETATTLDNLGVLYFRQAKYDKAEPLYQRALTIREKLLGPDHPHTALSLRHLAALQGNYDKAKPLYQWEPDHQ